MTEKKRGPISPPSVPQQLSIPVTAKPTSSQEEIKALEEYKNKLLEDLKNLEKRIKELKKRV